MRTRVKICGLTRPADVAHCEAQGADMLGFVFAPISPRQVTVEQAVALLRRIRWAQPVGLFMNQPAEEVGAIVEQLPALGVLQFHGNEDAAFCSQFDRPWIKALAGPAVHRHTQYPTAAAILIDAHAGSTPGGSGQTFDWHRLPGDIAKPVLLAGGITPDNVASAIATTRPFAIDISSGVEAAPGHKDHFLVSRLFAEVQRADSGIS